MFRIALLLVCLAAGELRAEQAGTAILDRWIARQNEIRTLTADFTQTRALRVLRSPVAAHGRLAFQAPGDFRWQVGDPARVVVLRKGDDVRVIEPPKKTVRVQAMEAGRRESGLMEFPFVRSRADLEKRFEILAVEVDGTVCRVKLAPRDAQGFLTALRLAFDTEDGHLITLEMAFRDGSSLRNEFTNVRVNEKLPAGTFSYDVTGFQTIDADR